MRGIVSGAMLSALADYDLTDSFDSVYALSAGAINSAYFVAGGGWQALSVYYDDLIGGDFINFARPLRGNPVVSLDYVLNDVMERTNPLDYSAVISAPVPLRVVVSSIDELQAVVLSNFEDKEDLKWALRASASLPMVGGPPLVRDNLRYFDGGVLMSHPVQAAVASSPTHVLAIRTRAELNRVKRTSPSRYLLAKRLDAYRNGLGALFLQQQELYSSAHLSSAAKGSHTFVGDIPVLNVACPPGSHSVSRLTTNRGALYHAIRVGYAAMLSAIFGSTHEVRLRPMAVSNAPRSESN